MNKNIFKTIVEFLPDWIMWLDKDRNIKYISPSVKYITGYEPEKFIENKRFILTIVHKEDKKFVLKRLNDGFNKPEICYFEFRIIHKNGDIKWIGHKCLPLFDENGKKITGRIISHSDITELKLTIEKLKSSESKYKEMYRLFRLMADNMPDLIWAKDINGKFLFVNKADAEFLGAKDTEEPLGKDDIFFTNRARQERPDINDWFTFGQLCINSDEMVIKNKKTMRFEEVGNVQGKFLVLDVCKSPIFDENGNLIGTVGHGRDVTKEKEIEKRLKESEEKYRKIFEESQDTIFISTIDGKFIDLNPAGLKFFGYDSFEEIKSKNISQDIYKNLKDREILIKRVKENGYIKDFEVVFKRKDGGEVIGLISATAIYDNKNDLSSFMGTIKDVTEKKALEAQLLQVQKMESIGRLAGGIAHDFNNMLTVINGYAELALKKISSNNPIYREITSILKIGQKAHKLIEQLLAFSRKQIYQPQIVNINDLIISMGNMLKRLIGKDIEIIMFLDKNIKNIEADPAQIEQIFVNLFVNAKDALDAVKKENFKKKMEVKTGLKFIANMDDMQNVKEYVYFSISDNGIGMNEEIQKRIFEPFYTTKEKYKGTGLGLAMVYGIVKQNNGFIDVYSIPEKGTKFTIYWPVTLKKAKNNKKGEESKIFYGKGNILVVEDEEDVREFTVEALKSLGYNVYETENGIKALKMLKEKKIEPDLIITDIIMPELNGLEFIEQVKKIILKIKVIYVSGFSENSIAHDGLLKKGINFIEKPYSLKKLSKIINQVITS